jgi:hypothetical protein
MRERLLSAAIDKVASGGDVRNEEIGDPAGHAIKVERGTVGIGSEQSPTDIDLSRGLADGDNTAAEALELPLGEGLLRKGKQ